MILVEFTLTHPTLRETFQAAPQCRFIWEQSHQPSDGSYRVIGWVEGNDVDAFEDGLAGDPSVTDYRLEAEAGARRLYQLTLSKENASMSVYPALMEESSIIERLTATSDGWQFQVTFPDREALDEFRAFCDDHDLRYEVTRIYEEQGGPDEHQEYGLTDKQRDLLEMATRQGYFDVPRKIGLEELAAEANISHQAASELLRRAQAALNRRALGFDGGDD